MPTEPSIRHLFSAPQPENTIDVAAVLRAARARRLPKVLGVTGVSLLAVGGIVLGVLQLSGGAALTSTAAGSSPESQQDDAGGSAEMYSDTVKRVAADQLNLCGTTVAEIDSSATGLVLSVDFPDAAVGAARVEGTVTLTNVGADAITGYTGASPVITLAQNGMVVWHSNGPVIDLAREVSLAPGQSMQYTASFTPVVCAGEDDLAESFPADLPAAPAGDYEVSAAIDVMGDYDALLVTGPAQHISLR